jgi:hypothetical protein
MAAASTRSAAAGQVVNHAMVPDARKFKVLIVGDVRTGTHRSVVQ